MNRIWTQLIVRFVLVVSDSLYHHKKLRNNFLWGDPMVDRTVVGHAMGSIVRGGVVGADFRILAAIVGRWLRVVECFILMRPVSRAK